MTRFVDVDKVKEPTRPARVIQVAKIASQSQFRETASRGTLRVPQSSAIHLTVNSRLLPPDHPAAFRGESAGAENTGCCVVIF